MSVALRVLGRGAGRLRLQQGCYPTSLGVCPTQAVSHAGASQARLGVHCLGPVQILALQDRGAGGFCLPSSGLGGPAGPEHQPDRRAVVGGPAPAFGGKAAARGALGRPRPKRRSNRIPKCSPLGAERGQADARGLERHPVAPVPANTPPTSRGQESGSLWAVAAPQNLLQGQGPLPPPEASLWPHLQPLGLPQATGSGWRGASSVCSGCSSFYPPPHHGTFQSRILRHKKPRAFGVFSLCSREKQTLVPV